jgi:hypothetical protein
MIRNDLNDEVLQSREIVCGFLKCAHFGKDLSKDDLRHVSILHLCLRLGEFHECERHRVHAITQAGRFRSIVKDMP